MRCFWDYFWDDATERRPKTTVRTASARARGSGPFNRAAISAVAVAFSALSVFGIGALPAAAQNAPAPRSAEALAAEGLVRLEHVAGGALLFLTDEPGVYVPAPLVETDIDVAVAGPIARTVVTQRFVNPSDVFVEGKYLFPLPPESAVDTLRMRVGDRLIEGEIKEREEAREIYETARREGYAASLVEQQRPNTFQTSVANIAPGAAIVIQIEYQETLSVREGVFGLRIPLVVAPRYEPEAQDPIGRVVLGPNGWVIEPPTDAEPIDPQIPPTPVADPRDEAADEIRNPVTLSVDLNAGFPLGPIASTYHQVSIQRPGLETAQIALQGPVPADRDFLLSWEPRELAEPYTAVFAEQTDDYAHYLLMITPPSLDATDIERRPREVIFVQDVSGSMDGPSIEQARAGLELGLRRLTPDDSFNIVFFSDVTRRLSPISLPATPRNVQAAISEVRAMRADGGTEMLPALEAALIDDGPTDGRIRQVIFLTDGQVTNEREMLRLIERDLGRSRLFTVGIGSAPNSYFMTAAAEAGRGAHVFIGDLSQVQVEMERLFRKIETPALTDLTVEIDGFATAEVWPNPLPDLYAGDPVVATIAAPLDAATRALPAVRLSGVRGGETWSDLVLLSEATARPGVSKLWARQRIRSLEAFLLSPEAYEQQGVREQVDAEILATALEFGLVSRKTSLVAVDVTPSRPTEQSLVTRDVPLNLPDGWDPEAFFGPERPSLGGAPTIDAQLQLDETQTLRLAQAATARQAAAATGAPLPATSTDWLLQALGGLGLMLLAAMLWVFRRRTA